MLRDPIVARHDGARFGTVKERCVCENALMGFAPDVFSLAAMPAWAQETRGNINGTIQDAQGVIPGANVESPTPKTARRSAHHERSGLLRSAAAAARSVSRDGGNAEFQDAQPGRRY